MRQTSLNAFERADLKEWGGDSRPSISSNIYDPSFADLNTSTAKKQNYTPTARRKLSRYRQQDMKTVLEINRD